jgi:hypothetical protein
MYDKKTIKVDAYDFFGYLIPGLILLFSVFLAHIGASTKQPFMQYFKDIDFLRAKFETIPSVAAVAVVVVLAYVLGHVVGSVAAFFFEKLVVKNIYGYPYKYLLFCECGKDDDRSTAYKALTVCIYIFIIVFIVWTRQVRGILMDWWGVVAVLFAYCFYVYRYSTSKAKKELSWFLSRVFWVVEWVCGHFVSQHQPFPEKFRSAFFVKFKKEFGFDFDSEIAPEVFWAIYWHVATGNEYVRAKIEKWMILYSFMRNLGCSLLMSAIVISVPQIYYAEKSVFIQLCALALVGLSSIFMIRYYYLYYNYYSKNTFRAFVFAKATSSLETDVRDEQDQ